MVGVLAACGQKGPLFLPTGEAATGRATLEETIVPSTSVREPALGASSPPTTGRAAPVRNP